MVIVYTYPSPQIFNPRMERSIVKPQGLNYRKTQFGPLVNSQAAGVYNAFPGKIIGVFKEQVRNPTFFTLPFAYYNIFCLHNVTFLLRDPVLSDIPADPHSTVCSSSTMFCTPLSVYKDIVLCLVTTQLQLFPGEVKE